MEQKETKFRLRLNLFDAIVILCALAVGAFLLWNRFKPYAASAGAGPAATIQFTVRLRRTLPGTGALINEGDLLVDVVKNFEVGTVVSSEVRPAVAAVLDENARTYVNAEIPGYEDIYIVMESGASISDERILVGSGYELRVGEAIYLRGPGYLGSGEVYAIERGV